MIDFQNIQLENKASYQAHLKKFPNKGCEYSFANLYLWGRQRYTVLDGNVVYFSQFNRKSVYLFPLCEENLEQTVEALIRDARERGIACRLTGMTEEMPAGWKRLFPGVSVIISTGMALNMSMPLRSFAPWPAESTSASGTT